MPCFSPPPYPAKISAMMLGNMRRRYHDKTSYPGINVPSRKQPRLNPKPKKRMYNSRHRRTSEASNATLPEKDTAPAGHLHVHGPLYYRRTSMTPEPTDALWPATLYDQANPLSYEKDHSEQDHSDDDEALQQMTLATYMENLDMSAPSVAPHSRIPTPPSRTSTPGGGSIAGHLTRISRASTPAETSRPRSVQFADDDRTRSSWLGELQGENEAWEQMQRGSHEEFQGQGGDHDSTAPTDIDADTEQLKPRSRRSNRSSLLVLDYENPEESNPDNQHPNPDSTQSSAQTPDAPQRDSLQSTQLSSVSGRRSRRLARMSSTILLDSQEAHALHDEFLRTQTPEGRSAADQSTVESTDEFMTDDSLYAREDSRRTEPEQAPDASEPSEQVSKKLLWPPPELRPQTKESRIRDICGHESSEGCQNTVGAWPRGVGRRRDWPTQAKAQQQRSASTQGFLVDAVSFNKHVLNGLQLNTTTRSNSKAFHHHNIRGRADFGCYWKALYNPKYKGDLPSNGIIPSEWCAGPNWYSQNRVCKSVGGGAKKAYGPLSA